MDISEDLKYSKTHEWIKQTGDTVKIGITDYAQDALGDLVFANLPEVGEKAVIGTAFADVESVKAVSDIYSPVSGTIIAVNEELIDAPERINEAPYEAWFVEVGEITETEELLDAAAYKKLCEEEK